MSESLSMRKGISKWLEKHQQQIATFHPQQPSRKLAFHRWPKTSMLLEDSRLGYPLAQGFEPLRGSR
jgi:hypothetical protein